MEEPIYEVLKPKECFIISQSKEGLLVVENHEDGEVVVRRVPVPKDEGDSRRMRHLMKCNRCGKTYDQWHDEPIQLDYNYCRECWIILKEEIDSKRKSKEK